MLISTFVQTIRYDMRVWVNTDEGNHNSAWKISLDHQSLGSLFFHTQQAFWEGISLLYDAVSTKR